MAFIRRVRTASGATAVQIAQYVDGRQRTVKHVGSAHTEAELGVLLTKARELLEDRAQGVDEQADPQRVIEAFLSDHVLNISEKYLRPGPSLRWFMPAEGRPRYGGPGESVWGERECVEFDLGPRAPTPGHRRDTGPKRSGVLPSC